jgi:hypothetical protein
MLSNCPRCGSSLTIKEAIQEYCSYCSRPTDRAAVVPLLQKDRANHALLKKNFDRLISEELRKSNFLPAA